MMVHEACGLSVEEVDETEMLVKQMVRGKPVSEANALIIHRLCGSVNNNARELYAMYYYGFLIGVKVSRQDMIDRNIGVE